MYYFLHDCLSLLLLHLVKPELSGNPQSISIFKRGLPPILCRVQTPALTVAKDPGDRL